MPEQPTATTLNSTSRVAVRFKHGEDYGEFCVTLRQDHVPFSYAGFKTILLAREKFSALPRHTLRLYNNLKTNGLLEILKKPDEPRPPLTPDEAEKVLQDITEELKEQFE